MCFRVSPRAMSNCLEEAKIGEQKLQDIVSLSVIFLRFSCIAHPVKTRSNCRDWFKLCSINCQCESWLLHLKHRTEAEARVARHPSLSITVVVPGGAGLEETMVREKHYRLSGSSIPSPTVPIRAHTVMGSAIPTGPPYPWPYFWPYYPF